MCENEKRTPKMEACDNFPLAMAYVRWQRLDEQKLAELYPPELALSRGTLFPDLDKPFCGRTVTGGKR